MVPGSLKNRTQEKELYKEGVKASQKETDEFFSKGKKTETPKTTTVTPKGTPAKETKK